MVWALMRAALAVVFCPAALPATHAEQIQAVPQIVDADTVYAGSTKIRLNGIDAPKMVQVCIEASVRRSLGSCSVDGEDVSRWLVRNGWALAFRRYSVAYVVSVPVDAQSRLPSPAAAAKPPDPNCIIKGNIKSARQCIYHMPGGHFYDRLDMQRNASRRRFCSEAEAQAAGCRIQALTAGRD
jgi:hypothetical protein